MYSRQPTTIPSINPTRTPTTIMPTINPTKYPTINSSIFPTIKPTVFPTTNPTILPTINSTMLVMTQNQTESTNSIPFFNNIITLILVIIITVSLCIIIMLVCAIVYINHIKKKRKNKPLKDKCDLTHSIKNEDVGTIELESSNTESESTQSNVVTKGIIQTKCEPKPNTSVNNILLETRRQTRMDNEGN